MNILIVDDMAVNRKLLRAILEAEGHSIMEAADGVEALEALNRQKVGTVISDILMPRMDGYRLCHEVRASENFCDLPFIFYTASFTSSSDEKLGLEMGADKFLTKPASVSEIIQALSEASTFHRNPFTPIEPSRELDLMKDYNYQLVAKLEQKITELAAHNEELLRSEQKLLLQSTALEMAANAMVITDTQGIILWVNPAFVTLTGYAFEETIGNTLRLLKSGQHDQEFYQNLWTTILAGRTWRGNFVNQRKDGSLFDDEHTITPVRSKQGAITHFIAIMNDVTERKRAEREIHLLNENLERRVIERTEQLQAANSELAKQAEREKETSRQLLETSRLAGMAEIATNVLHGVGNVLNSVNVSSGLIRDKIQKSKIATITNIVVLMDAHKNNLPDFLNYDPKGKRLLGYLTKLDENLADEQKEILEEVQRLLEFILHIKKIVAMQQDYARVSEIGETLNIEDLVEDALRLNSGVLEHQRVKLVREYSEMQPAFVERHKVLQILVNLIRNAQDACDDSGRNDTQITLRITHHNDRVTISIIDNGIGIPSEDLTRIFNQGFTKKKGGHGFGLHSGALTAKEIGGTLIAFSEGCGRGSTFTLELPIGDKNDLRKRGAKGVSFAKISKSPCRQELSS
jgi:PAS domain S-box-containing protein